MDNELLTADSFWKEGQKGWGEMTRTDLLYSKDFSTVYIFYIENVLMQNTGTASWCTRIRILKTDLSSNLIFLWGVWLQAED